MKWINNISVLFLTIIYFLSASGIVVFQSYCLCTGNNHVSMYVTPETCEDNFHTNHSQMQGGGEEHHPGSECSGCASHTKDCGCRDFDVNYLKLNDNVVFEKMRSKITLSVISALPDLNIHIFTPGFSEPVISEISYIEPPITLTSLEFLIHIQQLKISYTA